MMLNPFQTCVYISVELILLTDSRKNQQLQSLHQLVQVITFPSFNKLLKTVDFCVTGWICYAEKTHGTWILPHVSEIKSAQQLAGKFFKDVLPNRLEVNRLAVAMVMPCFDKKLEASRNDFIRQDVKDVDYVITPVEIEQILDQLSIDFVNLNQSDVDSLLPGAEFDSEWSIPAGSGSGGFADHVLRYAAKELFGQTLDSVEFKIGRNSDVREAVLEKDGKTLLTVAVINGFKNIQNLVQKMKRKKCNYDYVEVMACPSGKEN